MDSLMHSARQISRISAAQGTMAFITGAKYALALLLLLNIRSLPFVWHLRTFWPVIKLQARYRILCLRILFHSAARKKLARESWYRSVMPLGKNPLKMQVVYRGWAGPDDCDFNMHLSNSCYPKIFDHARLKAALVIAPTFLRVGGWVGLGATHHHFIREIPMFARFEVRVSVGTWGDKWMYVVVRCVSHAKPRKESSPVTKTLLHTPAMPRDTDTPSEYADTPPHASAAARSLAAALAHSPEPDGATLHCVAVTALVYKIGRITVPIALVLAHEGCGDVSAAPPMPRPPKEMRALLAGGWRDMPKEERWWERTLGGEIERVRAERLPAFEGLTGGLEAAREYQVTF